MSLIVEVPSLFTRSAHIASRIGNTTLTGNERINGNFIVNGSLILNGDIDDSVITFESYDISNLNVFQRTYSNYLSTVSMEVAELGTLKQLKVNNQSILTGLSCENLKVNHLSTMNDALISVANIGTLNVTDETQLDTLSCQSLEVNGTSVFEDASFQNISVKKLDISFVNIYFDLSVNGDIVVNGHSDMIGISCETLKVTGNSIFSKGTFTDICAGILDVSLVNIDSDLNVKGHSDLIGLSCESLQVNKNSIFKNSISYQNIDRSIVTTLGPLFWIVAHESLSRINEANVTTNQILQGTIFGKKYWAPKLNGTIKVNMGFNSSSWAVAFAFGVVNQKSGTLFYADGSNNIVLNGPNLIVNQNSTEFTIPSFSVMVVNKSSSNYSVYVNGIFQYNSLIISSTATPLEISFGGGGIQLLASALWNKVLSEAQIETLTLETLT